MLVGIRDGKAVAVRGNADHAVNRGKLCPKGLSEHRTIAAEGRATHPLLFLSAAEKPAGDREWNTLVPKGAAPNYISQQVIQWANRTPDDPHRTCPRCTSTVADFADASGGCQSCRNDVFHFDGAFRMGPYDGRLRDAILHCSEH